MKPIQEILTNSDTTVTPAPLRDEIYMRPAGDADCPVCKGSGYFVPDVQPWQAGFGQAQKCGCFNYKADPMRLLSQSGLESAEYEWTIDFIAQMSGKESAYWKIKTLVEMEKPIGIYTLYGTYGVGKSGLLKAAVATVCKNGIKGLYRRAADILSEARATFTDDAAMSQKSVESIRRYYVSVPFLVIDEPDRAARTEWAQEFLFTLLDARYNKRHTTATLMSTNSKPNEMPGELQYLESRLTDGQRVIMGGKVLRGTI